MAKFDEGWKEGGYRKHIPGIPARTMVDRVSGQYLLASYDHFGASVQILHRHLTTSWKVIKVIYILSLQWLKEYQISGSQNNRLICPGPKCGK